MIQAEVFNRYLTARLALGMDRLLVGEIVRLSGSSRHFEVEDPAVELPRLHSKDIFLSGPMIGPKTKNATRDALPSNKDWSPNSGWTTPSWRSSASRLLEHAAISWFFPKI